ATAAAGISGWPGDNSYRFRGLLDEFAIFNGTLTNQQVTDLYNAGANGTYPATVLSDSPIAYYRLGEQGGSVAVDATANHNNGTMATITGQPTWATSDVPFYAGPAPAVRLTVTNTADSGPGSLRQVLLDANALTYTVPAVIQFA